MNMQSRGLASPNAPWAAIVPFLLGYRGLLLPGGSLQFWTNIVSRTVGAVFGRFVYLIHPIGGRNHDWLKTIRRAMRVPEPRHPGSAPSYNRIFPRVCT